MVQPLGQRQQGRDAAQLARRPRCRACSTPSRSAVDAGAPGSRCTRAPTGGTSRRDDVRDDRRVRCGALARRGRVQHRRRSAARSAGAGPRGAARPVHARARDARRDHQPGRLAAGRRDASACRRRSRGCRRAGIRVSLFVDPEPDADPLGRRSAGADRVELYTEPFARAFERGPTRPRRSFAQLRGGGRGSRTRSASASTPATISTSTTSCCSATLPHLDEVSIGHAIISRACSSASRPWSASTWTCCASRESD